MSSFKHFAAATARAEAIKAIKDEVETAIIHATRAGKFRVEIERKLPAAIKQGLGEAEYQVSYDEPRNLTTIQWRLLY